jgi:2-keto-4-pentenoate hydratase/2-oxohepta-3-ene-1,7-dioic acid hydratase in catechol pathway
LALSGEEGTLRLGTLGGRLVLIADDRALDVHDASNGRVPRDPLEGLAQWRAVRDWATAASWNRSIPVSPAQLGPPVPVPRQVFAVALNYRPHAAEAGFEAPADPLIFTKFPSCITGPAAEVGLPPGHVDWEAELVAVVGTGGYRVPVAEAWAALAGLTVGQDLSERISQLAGQPAQLALKKLSTE